MTDRQIDRSLAIHLMGVAPARDEYGRWWVRNRSESGILWGQSRLMPRYSTTWEGMGLVVDAMRTKPARGYDGWWCRITSPFEPGDPWFVGFTPIGWTGWNGRPDHEAGDAAAPMAAALAALKALGVEVTGG